MGAMNQHSPWIAKHHPRGYPYSPPVSSRRGTEAAAASSDRSSLPSRRDTCPMANETCGQSRGGCTRPSRQTRTLLPPLPATGCLPLKNVGSPLTRQNVGDDVLQRPRASDADHHAVVLRVVGNEPRRATDAAIHDSHQQLHVCVCAVDERTPEVAEHRLQRDLCMKHLAISHLELIVVLDGRFIQTSLDLLHQRRRVLFHVRVQPHSIIKGCTPFLQRQAVHCVGVFAHVTEILFITSRKPLRPSIVPC